MARRANTNKEPEYVALPDTDLAPSMERLAEATALLLKVAERLDQSISDMASPITTPLPETPVQKRPRRKNADEQEKPTEAETAQAVKAALDSTGEIDGGSGDGDTSRVQMNAPSDEVFGRFFGKVLELYEINLQRQAEERGRRFHSKDREELVKEIKATIDVVLTSPLITNAEKNEALRILIKQIVPHKDHIEITYL